MNDEQITKVALEAIDIIKKDNDKLTKQIEINNAILKVIETLARRVV